MSTVIISASAATAGNSYAPPAGKKWILISAYLQLSSGATAGTRNMALLINRSNGGSKWFEAEQLAAIPNQTTVSSVYTTGISPTGVLFTQSTAPYTMQYLPSLNHADRLSIAATLVSGDTISYAIEVDEVIDE